MPWAPEGIQLANHALDDVPRRVQREQKGHRGRRDDELIEHCKQPAMPVELRKLGRILQRWFDKICNFYIARVSNGPAEALNNLIQRIKRIGFGLRNFRTYRIRALLHAGKSNWRVLGPCEEGTSGGG